MPRGVSLVPQRSSSGHDVPLELQNSIFESKPLLPGNTNTTNNNNASGNSSTARPAHVRVFDYDGNMTTKQVGVHDFQLRKQAMFYWLRAQSWVSLISFSILLYVSILACISVLYFAWARACGARDGTSFVSSFYFTIVSLAANGGYLGEADSMVNPTSICYAGRTVLVMICSYGNIVFVGLVAALIVSKAESTAKLASRIAFSHYCTLVAVPGHLDLWKLSFRMANLDNQKPLAHGRLRLFVVSAEPLKEYRQEKRARLQQKRRRHVQEQARLNPAATVKTVGPLTADTLTQKKQVINNSSFSNIDDPTLIAFLKFKADAEQREAEERKAAQRHKGKSRRAKRALERRSADTSRTGKMGSPSPLRSAGDSGEFAATGGSRGSPTSRTAVARLTGGTTDTSKEHVFSPSSSSTSSEDFSARTNTSVSSADSPTMTTGADALTAQTSVTPFPQQRHGLSATTALMNDGYKNAPCYNSQHSVCVMAGGDGDETDGGEAPMERVHITARELQWVCQEETYLDKSSGELSLWYPATITHIIDERSPLQRFMDTAASSPSAARSQRGLSSRRFQIIAVFDATEMESGSTIMAKNTYTTTDIVTHYKFSNKLVHMQADSSEVFLDYHYFNEILPVMATESSTTDSDM